LDPGYAIWKGISGIHGEKNNDKPSIPGQASLEKDSTEEKKTTINLRFLVKYLLRKIVPK
jgi:hypothetical protein